MLKKVEFEAKTASDAMKKAVESLGISEDKIKLEIVKEKRGILGIGGSTTYSATPNIDLATEGKLYLDNIISALGIEAKMELRNIDSNEIYYRIHSTQNAILIGRDGKTLMAIQSLLRNYLASFVDQPIIISLDIGKYNETRKRTLEILATKTAKEVIRLKKSIKLNPMNAFDRRIIHAKLSDWHDVETESQGEKEQRSVVIKPKKRS